ncbi:MAG: hypothetical protein ACI8S6_005314 [Myxococcota bacterium]|jgi:hypothetical protein
MGHCDDQDLLIDNIDDAEGEASQHPTAKPALFSELQDRAELGKLGHFRFELLQFPKEPSPEAMSL